MELIDDIYDLSIGWIEHDETDKIRDLLLGHRVAKVAKDHIQLDDGTLCKIFTNEGCLCGSGSYSLRDLNEVDNIITRVDFKERTIRTGGEAWDDYDEKVYEVFVLAEDRRLLFAVQGSDGNGYYGTGYTLLIRPPKPT